jgi:hypothetical protein
MSETVNVVIEDKQRMIEAEDEMQFTPSSMTENIKSEAGRPPRRCKAATPDMNLCLSRAYPGPSYE